MAKGDIVEVRQGEKVPVDGVVREFKYYKSKDAGIVDHLEEAHLEDAQQPIGVRRAYWMNGLAVCSSNLL